MIYLFDMDKEIYSFNIERRWNNFKFICFSFLNTNDIKDFQVYACLTHHDNRGYFCINPLLLPGNPYWNIKFNHHQYIGFDISNYIELYEIITKIKEGKE